MIGVEIAIPVLNEEATLERNVIAARAAIDRLFAEPQAVGLVIADNGSTDGTQAIALELQKSVPGLRYLRLPRPGVGAALKQAWLTSDADIVGYMDLDLATDVRHLPEAVDAIRQGAAVCYGSRLHPQSKVVGRKLSRTVVSHAFNLVLRAYLGARFSDGMCGFKFLRRSALPDLMARGAVSDGWFFSTELLLAAERMSLPVAELPVDWTDDPDSRVRMVRLTLQYLRAMRVFRARDRVVAFDAEQTLPSGAAGSAARGAGRPEDPTAKTAVPRRRLVAAGSNGARQ